MFPAPRLAVGHLPEDEATPALLWALLETLQHWGKQVQLFEAKASPCNRDGGLTATGRCTRHLDSWLMSRRTCRRLFLSGARQADFSVVYGRFGDSASGGETGPINAISHWLDLPRIATVDVRRWGQCRLPAIPGDIDALILDRLPNAASFSAFQTHFETYTGLPVLGGLTEMPGERAIAAAVPAGERPSRELCRALGENLRLTLRPERLMGLATRRALPVAAKRCDACLPVFDAKRPLRVAVAYDDAFHGYFPDTLEMLEQCGAELRDFSPLHDQQLPAGTNLVYFGGGHPERFACQLAANACMQAALRRFASAGKRIYAEGGGLAYLCRHLELPGRGPIPMAGVLPAAASFRPSETAQLPTEIKVTCENWLTHPATDLRGYLDSRWSIVPAGPMLGLAYAPRHRLHMVASRGVIASRMHLHFASQRKLLRGFFRPRKMAANSLPSNFFS